MTEAKTETKSSTEVWITGIGLATSLGEGLDAHWDALKQHRINVASGFYRAAALGNDVRLERAIHAGNSDCG